MNAWEEGTLLYVDGMQVEQAPLFPRADGSVAPPANPSAVLSRWHFDLDADGGSYDQMAVDDFPGEFPRIDDRYTGYAYRHGWFTGHAGDQGEKLNSIVHFDPRRRRRSTYRLPPVDSSSAVVLFPPLHGPDAGAARLLSAT